VEWVNNRLLAPVEVAGEAESESRAPAVAGMAEGFLRQGDDEAAALDPNRPAEGCEGGLGGRRVGADRTSRGEAYGRLDDDRGGPQQ
jgi:hypothetical protein